MSENGRSCELASRLSDDLHVFSAESWERRRVSLRKAGHLPRRLGRPGE